MRPACVFVLSAFGFSLVAQLAACSDDRPAAVDLSGTSGSSSSSSSSSGSSADAATDSGLAADLCTPVEQLSQVVSEQQIPGTPAAPSGGTLKPGLYVLNELQAYGYTDDGGSTDPQPPGPTGNYGRATMVITPQALKFIASPQGTNPEALPPDNQRVVTYKVVGTSLELTAACASNAAQSAIPYSVEAPFVRFYVAPQRIEVYRLKP